MIVGLQSTSLLYYVDYYSIFFCLNDVIQDFFEYMCVKILLLYSIACYWYQLAASSAEQECYR